MIRNRLQPKTLLKNMIAALLTITLSGAYFLLCCQAMSAASQPAHHSSSEASRIGHCNFSKSESSATSKAATGVNAFDCCPLRFEVFVAKLEKKEFPKQTPVSANNFSGFPESVNLKKKAGFADRPDRAPVFATRDLHIKNCVFRI